VLSDDPGSLVPNKRTAPDHKLYFTDLKSKEEAHYLCAYLNSHPVRTWLGGFLNGKQIGTSIFEFMQVPLFAPDNPEHQRLSAISLEAHASRLGGRGTGPLDKVLEDELTQLVRSVAAKGAPGYQRTGSGRRA
jgi:hypothetical protein